MVSKQPSLWVMGHEKRLVTDVSVFLRTGSTCYPIKHGDSSRYFRGYKRSYSGEWGEDKDQGYVCYAPFFLQFFFYVIHHTLPL